MSESISRRELLLAAVSVPALAGVSPTRNPLQSLGRSALKVTRLGVGLDWDACDPKMIRRAVDLGINHFNVFPQAGDLRGFKALGATLRPVREKVVVASCPYRGSKGKTTDEMRQDLEVQLREMDTDHIDLWYMTSTQKVEDLNDGFLEYMRAAKQAGKIRAAAVSTHNFAAVTERLTQVADVIDAVMVTCNFATWGDTRDNILRLRDAGIGIVAMKPLMGGLQFVPSDRRAWAQALPPGDRRNRALTAATKWIVQNRSVDTAPVRISDIEQLERNARAASEALTESEIDLLAAEVDRISPYYCRMCQRCEGTCRQGLPVSDIIRFVMYADGYQKLPAAQAGYRQLSAAQRKARCTDCQDCTVHCPNGVGVRERLTRAQMLLNLDGESARA